MASILIPAEYLDGFAVTINDASGIKQRISAACIVIEGVDYVEQVLTLLGTFGTDTAQYSVHHPWAA